MRIRSGFTLIEILVAITLFSIVFLSLFEVYGLVLGIQGGLSGQRMLQENSRTALSLLSRQVDTIGIDVEKMRTSPFQNIIVFRDGSYIGVYNGSSFISSDFSQKCLGEKKCCLALQEVRAPNPPPLCITDNEATTIAHFTVIPQGQNRDKIEIVNPFPAGFRVSIGFVAPNRLPSTWAGEMISSKIPHLHFQTSYYDRIFQQR